MSEEKVKLGIGSRVRHGAYGDGCIIGHELKAYEVCFMTYGLKHVGLEYDAWEVIEAIPAKDGASFDDFENSLIKILQKYSAISEDVDLGDKWDDGVLILKPKDPTLQPKEIPIDTFFHKIVMVRDRLRVMEQRINSSKMTDEEKVNLQQYITRIYGSLTTFNVLFKYKDDHFKGDSSK